MITPRLVRNQNSSLVGISRELGIHGSPLRLVRDIEHERELRHELRGRGNYYGVRCYRLASGEQEVGTVTDTIYPHKESFFRVYDLDGGRIIEHQIPRFQSNL